MSQFVKKDKEKIVLSIEETDLLLRILNDTDFKGSQVVLASKLMEKVIRIHTNLMNYKVEV